MIIMKTFDKVGASSVLDRMQNKLPVIDRCFCLIVYLQGSLKYNEVIIISKPNYQT